MDPNFKYQGDRFADVFFQGGLFAEVTWYEFPGLHHASSSGAEGK